MNNKKILRSNLTQSYYNKKDSKEQNNIPTDKESMLGRYTPKKNKKIMKENMKE